jgi:hypothetical protein
VINWDQNTVVRLQLWDIAGQERFGNMTRVYYREAVGAFVVFDVTRVATFEAVQKWKNDIDSKVRRMQFGGGSFLTSVRSRFRPTIDRFRWCCSQTSAT